MDRTNRWLAVAALCLGMAMLANPVSATTAEPPVDADTMLAHLTERPRDFGNLTYELEGQVHALADFLAMPEAIGLLVVQNGNVLLEHYAPGNDRQSRWISFSVTKSVTSLLIGAAIADGCIRSVPRSKTTQPCTSLTGSGSHSAWNMTPRG